MSENDGSFPMAADVAVYVKQDESVLQIITGLQTRNHYTLYDSRGIQVGFLAERDTGMLSAFARMLLRSRRSFLMDVYDLSGKIVATLSRPFYWFFSELTIETGSGRRVGAVRRRFSVFRPVYELCDSRGKCIGKLRGSFFGGRGLGNIVLGNQNYYLLDPTGSEEVRGGVERQWSGLFNRMFTDKDAYMVTFPKSLAKDWNPEEKLILLSAAVSIDFDYYEDRRKGLIEETGIAGTVTNILTGSR
jgi:uncharacterized protein YxjI